MAWMKGIKNDMKELGLVKHIRRYKRELGKFFFVDHQRYNIGSCVRPDSIGIKALVLLVYLTETWVGK